MFNRSVLLLLGVLLLQPTSVSALRCPESLQFLLYRTRPLGILRELPAFKRNGDPSPTLRYLKSNRRVVDPQKQLILLFSQLSKADVLPIPNPLVPENSQTLFSKKWTVLSCGELVDYLRAHESELRDALSKSRIREIRPSVRLARNVTVGLAILGFGALIPGTYQAIVGGYGGRTREVRGADTRQQSFYIKELLAGRGTLPISAADQESFDQWIKLFDSYYDRNNAFVGFTTADSRKAAAWLPYNLMIADLLLEQSSKRKPDAGRTEFILRQLFLAKTALADYNSHELGKFQGVDKRIDELFKKYDPKGNFLEKFRKELAAVVKKANANRGESSK